MTKIIFNNEEIDLVDKLNYGEEEFDFIDNVNLENEGYTNEQGCNN